MPSDSILLLKTDKTPLPKQAGILLAIPAQGTGLLGKDAWLHGCLALSETDLEWAPAETWFKSLVVTAISRANQFPYVVSIIGDKMVFPEEIHSIPSAEGPALTCLAFNIKPVVSIGLRPETYHIHAACLSHRSDTIEIPCG
jgi:hypothetical protein